MTPDSDPRTAERGRAEAAQAAGEAGRADAAPVEFRAAGKVDILDYVAAAGTGRRQSLSGFDPDYTDIVDYIVRCTHKMWEEGGIGLLYDHYAQNTVVWSDWGVTYGRERTIEYVIQRLAGFPDLRLYADDVVWTGDDRAGFTTCHRIMQIGHNDGHSKYGPPTGRRIQFRSFANCVVRENRIVEEWMAHDELTVVRQLGLDVDETLRELAGQLAAGAGAGAIGDLVGEAPRVAGQTTTPVYTPRHPGRFDPEDFVRQGLHEIWNWRLLNQIPLYYAPTGVVHAPSGRELYGHGDVKAYVLALLAAFPDALLQIDDLYRNGDERDGYRTAVRWTLLGTHRGLSGYGRPTGRPVRILGTTSHLIRGGRIVEEWTLFNELALLWKLHYA